MTPSTDEKRKRNKKSGWTDDSGCALLGCALEGILLICGLFSGSILLLSALL